MSNLSGIDSIILLIFLFSAVMGLIRGFVKEIFSLVTWVAAFILASMFASPLAAMFSGTLQSSVSAVSSQLGSAAASSVSMLAIVISYIIIFVATLVVGSLIGFLLSRAAESQGVSIFNRLLGALFGLARGALVMLVIIFLVQLTGLKNQSWWTQSQIIPSFQPAVAWLDNVVSPGLATLKSSVGGAVDNAGASITNTIKGAVSK